jgi:DNA-binding NarL/FixJ family response regulator
MAVRILIADDHAVVRVGIKQILETQNDLSVVGMADNGRDAVSKAEALRPDVVLMDIAMPDLNGIEATRLICAQMPTVRVVILSMYHTGEHVFRAMQAGARGYVIKEAAGGEIVKAVRAVMRGRSYFSKGVTKPPEEGVAEIFDDRKSPLASLSAREREVLQFVVEGKTSAAIAKILSLSPKSVETYRSRLMKKLGVENVPSLVKFALQHGFASLE